MPRDTIFTPDALVGTSMGSYRLERLLGAGGMGAVYEGVHPLIGARVAIKVLLPEVANNPTVVERFFNEARAVNLIGHPNLVKVLDMSVSGGRYYLVMELLAGQPLTALARPGEPVPFAEAAPILIQCADALQAAHDRGIVHRDIKPDNIFLAAEPGRPRFVKILDFGIAKLAAEAGGVVRTAAGMVMGTPAFMSPEQAEGAADKLDGRSDVYSLGVVAFQLATGSLPFPEPTQVRVMMAHLTTQPPRPTKLAPRTPVAFERVILRCLAKEREDRYQSMRELKAALEQALLEAGGEAPELPTQLTPAASRPSPFPPAVPILGSGMPDEPLPGAEMFEALEAPAPEVALQAARAPERLQPPVEEPLELDLPPPAPEPVEAPSKSEQLREAAASSRGPLWAVGAALLLAGAGVAWLVWGGAPQAAPSEQVAAPAGMAPAAPSEQAPTAPAAPGAALACPAGAVRTPPGVAVELQLVTVPPGARVRASWEPDGCALGTTPFRLAAPAGVRVRLRYLLAGRPARDAEVLADAPRVVLESLSD